ncbi:hypothetical protein N658DRAFT_250272 [Parathielavia hyrcaniae]|uniref:Uncharacterized protein n=1 Tax=Parathielavia hyrcaniae TaxID=113614 RepID=A0AAN6Q673_9PEZI|nr:hypothetical protein N658DRAFT_250272 [Parathielavia hyrcaniae]
MVKGRTPDSTAYFRMSAQLKRESRHILCNGRAACRPICRAKLIGIHSGSSYVAQTAKASSRATMTRYLGLLSQGTDLPDQCHKVGGLHHPPVPGARTCSLPRQVHTLRAASQRPDSREQSFDSSTLLTLHPRPNPWSPVSSLQEVPVHSNTF